MGIGISILFVVAGAVFLLAVEGAMTIGWVLLIVGVIGVLLSIMFWAAWGVDSRTTRVVKRR
jgi:hypothetical protein